MNIRKQESLKLATAGSFTVCGPWWGPHTWGNVGPRQDCEKQVEARWTGAGQLGKALLGVVLVVGLNSSPSPYVSGATGDNSGIKKSCCPQGSNIKVGGLGHQGGGWATWGNACLSSRIVGCKATTVFPLGTPSGTSELWPQRHFLAASKLILFGWHQGRGKLLKPYTKERSALGFKCVFLNLPLNFQ